MLFGKPKRGMFDLPETYQTPPIAPPQDYGNGPIAPQQSAGREPGTGIGALIVGSIGDALLQHSGGQPVYAQNMMQRREMAMRSQQAAAERQAKWEDWKRQFDYEAAHPKPVNNDTVNDFNWYKSLSPEDRAIYDQQHPVVVQGPDGPYVVPRSAIGGNAPLGGNKSLGTSLPQGWTVQGGASTQPAGRPFRY